jgi:hypothetical protein
LSYLGISYHSEHVCKIVGFRLRWARQRPRRKARERDEVAIDH